MQRQLIGTSEHTDASSATTPAMIPVGVRVELRSRFDDRWTHGFAVAECGEGEYQLRRLSDGAVLPAWFPAGMLRPVLEG